MGGDRRSPPRHRGRGGGGGRNRSARGGAALSGSNGMFNQSLRFKNENSASKKHSVLKKDSGFIFVKQDVDLVEERQTCVENQDLSDQEFNNSYEDENVEQRSGEGKGNNGNLEFTDSVINSDYNLDNRNYRSEDKFSCCLENREPVNQEDMDAMIDGDMRAMVTVGDIISDNSMLKKVGIEEGHPFILNDKGSEGIEEGLRSESVERQDMPDLTSNRTVSTPNQEDNGNSFSDKVGGDQRMIANSFGNDIGDKLVQQNSHCLLQGMTFKTLNPLFWNGEVSSKDHLDCDMGVIDNRNVLKVNGEYLFSEDKAALDDIQVPVGMECTEGICLEVPSNQNISPVACKGTDLGADNHVRHGNEEESSGLFKQGKGQPNAWKRPSHVEVDWSNRGKASLDGKFVDLNLEAVNQNKVKLEKALVGKLIGKRLPFNVLENELRKRWDHFGEFKFLMIGEESFTCIFQSCEARDAVLMGGPWLIGGYIVGLDRWTSTFSQGSMKGLSAPIWIRMPNLPLLYWDNDNLARIASMIGPPLWIDAQTSLQGRCSYARVCVRLDLAQKIPTGVWIHGVEGNFFQKVEFEGLNQVCFNCGYIGHKEDVCALISKGSQQEASGKNVLQPNGYKGRSSFDWEKGFNKVRMNDSREVGDSANCGDKMLNSSFTTHFEVGESSVQALVGPVDMVEPMLVGVGEEEDEVYGPWIYVTRKKSIFRKSVNAAKSKSLKSANVAAMGISVNPDLKQNLNGKEGRFDGVRRISSQDKFKGREVHVAVSNTCERRIEHNPGDFVDTFDRLSRKDLSLPQDQTGKTYLNKPTAEHAMLIFSSKAKEGSGLQEKLKSAVPCVGNIKHKGTKGPTEREIRGSNRVPSAREISRLGPIATGSRKRRKGDSDCGDLMDLKEFANKEPGGTVMVIKEGTSECGGDASPLVK